LALARKIPGLLAKSNPPAQLENYADNLIACGDDESPCQILPRNHVEFVVNGSVLMCVWERGNAPAAEPNVSKRSKRRGLQNGVLGILITLLPAGFRSDPKQNVHRNHCGCRPLYPICHGILLR